MAASSSALEVAAALALLAALPLAAAEGFYRAFLSAEGGGAPPLRLR